MHRLLPKLLIKNYKDTKNSRVRNAYGTLTSIFGIVFNLILSVAKMTIGALFGSISMLADGVNNLSDMTSSGISLVGFRISNKPADAKHPFGHARVEYVSSLIIAMIIIIVGIQLGISSVQSIIANNMPKIDNLLLIVLGVSIVAKTYMAFFYYKMSKKISSSALKAVCIDSINDVVATSVVLIAAIITRYSGVNLDGYAGVLVSSYILIAGIRLAIETLSPLLGEKPSQELVDNILNEVKKHPEILGVHDLIAHNYGANKYFVTLHAEVDSTVDILISHELIDEIENQISTDEVHLVIHMDPVMTNDEVTDHFKDIISKVINDINPLLHFHDFRVVIGRNHNNLIFDLVCCDNKYTQDDLCELINEQLLLHDKSCKAVIKLDHNYVDTK